MNNVVTKYGRALNDLCKKIQDILNVLHPEFQHNGVIRPPYLTISFSNDGNKIKEHVNVELDTYEFINESFIISIPSEYFDMTDAELLATGAFLL